MRSIHRVHRYAEPFQFPLNLPHGGPYFRISFCASGTSNRRFPLASVRPDVSSDKS
jgi:hypothetical protein